MTHQALHHYPGGICVTDSVCSQAISLCVLPHYKGFNILSLFPTPLLLLRPEEMKKAKEGILSFISFFLPCTLREKGWGKERGEERNEKITGR